MKKGKRIFSITAIAAFIATFAVTIASITVINKPSDYTAGNNVSVASTKAAVLTQTGERTVVAYQKENGNSLVAYDKKGEELWVHTLSTYYTLLESVGQHIFIGEGRTLKMLDLNGNVVDSFSLGYTPRSMSLNKDVVVFNSSLSAAKNLLSVFHYDGQTVTPHYEIDFNRNIVQTAVTNGGKVIFATSVAVFECVPEGGSYTSAKIFDSVNTVKGLYVDEADNIYLATINGCLEIYRNDNGNYVGLKAIEFGKDASVISSDGNGLIATFDYAGNVLLYDTVKGDVRATFRSYASAYSLSMAAEGALMIYKQGANLSYYDTDKIGAFMFFQNIRTPAMIASIAAFTALLVTVITCFPKGDKKVRHIANEVGKNKDVYIFLLPTFALLIVFNYYTMIKGFSLAFQKYIPGVKAEFVGFDNFVNVFRNLEFWSSTGNMVIFLVTDILKALIPPFIIAEVIHSVSSKKAQYYCPVSLIGM